MPNAQLYYIMDGLNFKYKRTSESLSEFISRPTGLALCRVHISHAPVVSCEVFLGVFFFACNAVNGL